MPYRQQHQMELEAAHVPGAVLPELVEAQLVRGRAHHTLTPPDRGLPGDGAPCSTGAVLLRCRAPTVPHEPRLCSRADHIPAPCSPTGQEGAGEETRARLLDATKSCSPMPNGAPLSQNPNAGLVAVALDPCQQLWGEQLQGREACRAQGM